MAEEEENLKVMGIFEHIDELRSRLVKSVAVLVVMFFVCYNFAPEILGFLKIPLVAALPPNTPSLYFTGPMDVFMANVKLGFFTATIISCPIWLYQLWKFLEPALYETEKKYILPFMFFSISLFLAGVALCYYVVLPIALEYLIGLGKEMGTTAIITISDYLSLVMLMMLGFGLVFETPIVLVLLALLDLISADTLRSNRRVIIVIITIVAAIATPTPDPISMLAMAFPMWLLFEGSILVIAWLKREKPADTKAG
ncbi:MAG: twin-arginine translocase subunit TatC [Proteobacteria bacterium]|nr:MAG: twin-arginine translocase subunit TatC [Pseudomonadota bacterium]